MAHTKKKFSFFSSNGEFQSLWLKQQKGDLRIGWSLPVCYSSSFDRETTSGKPRRGNLSKLSGKKISILEEKKCM
jgi:hypothetical protein